MINSNWNRWIFASASKYFKDTLASTGTPFIIEGAQVKTDGDAYEFRLSGPLWKQRTSTQWHGSIVINILVRATQSQKDFHKIYKMVGPVEGTFVQTIPVIKYGITNDDDNTTVIGCLQLESTPTGDVKTIHFGQVVPSLALIQSTVEGNYKLDIQTDF